MSESDVRSRRFRLTLLLVFVVCAGPFVLAWFWYAFHGSPELGSTTNAGELVHPARPLDSVTLPVIASRDEAETRAIPMEGKWTVLTVASPDCDKACMERLWVTRQIRLSLGRDMGRVRRVLLIPRDAAEPDFYREEHEDLSVLALDSPAARELLEQLKLDDGVMPQDSGRLYIIDPLGNLMMYFEPGFDPDDYMSDLKRLLRVSQIG